MEKSAILNKYSNDEDKLFISKILDKIKLSKTRNQIVNTDFLDMYQKKISTEILKIEKEENYIFYKPWEETDRSLLIIYPEKFLFHNQLIKRMSDIQFSFRSSICRFPAIRQFFKIYTKVGIACAKSQFTAYGTVYIVMPGQVYEIADILAAQSHGIQATIAALPIVKTAIFKMPDEMGTAFAETKPRSLDETVPVFHKSRQLFLRRPVRLLASRKSRSQNPVEYRKSFQYRFMNCLIH